MRRFFGICVALTMASTCLAAPPTGHTESQTSGKGQSLAEKFDSGLAGVRSRLTELVVPKSTDSSTRPKPVKPHPHKQSSHRPVPKPQLAPEEYPLPADAGDPAHSFQHEELATDPVNLPPPPMEDSPNLGEAIAADDFNPSPAEMKLHERLSLFRQSAFDDLPAAPTATHAPAMSGEASATDSPAAKSTVSTIPAHDALRQEAEPETRHGGSSATPVPAAPPPMEPPVVRNEPTLAPPKPKSFTMMADRAASSMATATDQAPVVSPGSTAAAPSPKVSTAAAASPNGVSIPKPITSNTTLAMPQAPVLQVETLGPRQIRIGVPSRYELAIRNSGMVAAEGVTVSVELPPSAEVMGAAPSNGQAETKAAMGKKTVVWQLETLAAEERQSLILELVPREARAFDLAVRTEHKPVATQASIEVQEPKLTLALEGPRDVLYGEQQTYRLKISNTGTGVAENIRLLLQPIDAGETPPAEHQIARLAPGQTESAEVELVTQFAGTLTLRVDATCDGGIESHLTERIVVRRAKLELSLEGADVKFVGNETLYNVRVKNTGDAAASNLKLEAVLPTGARYVSDTRHGRISATRDRLTWDIGTLEKGSDTFVSVKCVLEQAGQGTLQISATADLGVSATTERPIVVDTKADLALEVTDPSGNVPVGIDTPYEITLRNRGTRDAENIEVVVYFSHGIEPISADGPAHRIAPGQIIFERIDSIKAGTDVKLIVHAMPERPGSHLIRVEAIYQPLDCRVVKEETTYFYKGPKNQGTQPALTGPAASTTRTAARPAPEPDRPATR